MNPRQTQILELLNRQGEVSVRDLAERYQVSVMTVRRDLALLEESGELTRTHGGAFLSKAGIIEFGFREKGRASAAQKHAIALEAAQSVRPGMAITIDTGTTCLEVARAVAGIRDLTVLTSSLAIASALYARDNIELVLLGGTARKGSPDLSGWLTEENLKRFRVHLAILGADGADAEGVFTTDVNVARVSQAMIAGARETLLVADHSKFERPAFVRYAAWAEITRVITDAGVGATTRKWLNKAAQVAYVRSGTPAGAATS